MNTINRGPGKSLARAFPVRSASDAVAALCEAWNELASRRPPGFQPSTHEPKLTRILKTHLESVVAKRRGLLGMWTAEPVVNTTDPETMHITEERRPDIVYGWNSNTQSLQLVFEFKKLTHQKGSRDSYLGPDGLERFVHGIYAQDQSVAAMVGILLDERQKIICPIRKSLDQDTHGFKLNLCLNKSGSHVIQPSELFDEAEFDTRHFRPAHSGKMTDVIEIAHIFLEFPP